MGNVLRVLARDALRLLKAPAALVVVLVLATLPSMYTWFNVVGFWNPYDNTGNLRVCVVNEDAGADIELMGNVNLGDQVIDQLHENTQLGWDFVDYDTAMEAVQSGSAYAAFVIPEDFSAKMGSLVSGEVRQPKLEYYVNEKAGPVSTKVTDTGATTLDQTINSTFVSTASEVVAAAIDAALDDSQGKTEASRSSVAARIGKAEQSVSDARTTIADLIDVADRASDKTVEAKELLTSAKDGGANLSAQLKEASELTLAAQNSLMAFSASLSQTLDQGSILLSQAAAKANASVGQAAGLVEQAQGNVGAAIQSGQAVVAENAAIIEQLRQQQQALPDDAQGKEELGVVIADLEQRNAEAERTLDSLAQLNSDVGATADSVAGAASSLNDAVQGSLDAAAGYRSKLSSTVFPEVNSGITQLAGATSSLAGAISSQSVLADQASAVLDQLAQTLETTTSALGQTDSVLASLQGSLSTVRTDLAALDTSGAVSELLGQNGSLDPTKIADFMLSPTELETESLYPLNSYGSAMAPLFTNLTLWIGVFMLMVILRLEVDDEGIPGLTVGQRYVAKWLFLAIICAIQAAICCTGNLIIGVQAVNVPAFYLTAIMASLAYLSVQYALSTVMQHVGKGLCIVAVFMQIPGATGLYPIEMTPPFFQFVYPLMPFTYGINGLRETIGGFYGGQWAHYMGVLAGFMVVFFVLGLILRPRVTNLNRLFSKKIAQSDILNGEEALVPPRRYRLGQLISALSDRDDYRAFVQAHAQRFLTWYPRLKWWALAVGIVVPVAVTLGLSLGNAGKVFVLTGWLVWLVVIIVVLVAVEFLRDNLEHQASLGSMSDDEVRTLVKAQNAPKKAPHAKAHAHKMPTVSERMKQAEAHEAAPCEEVPREEAPSCEGARGETVAQAEERMLDRAAHHAPSCASAERAQAPRAEHPEGGEPRA